MRPKAPYDEAEYLELGIKGISNIATRAKLTFEAPFETKITTKNPATFGAYSFFRGGRVTSLQSIGRFCSVALGVAIGDGEHPVSFLSTHHFQYGANFSIFGAPFEEKKSKRSSQKKMLRRILL